MWKQVFLCQSTSVTILHYAISNNESQLRFLVYKRNIDFDHEHKMIEHVQFGLHRFHDLWEKGYKNSYRIQC